MVSKSHKKYVLGEVIIRCEPLVNVIHIEYKGKRCDNCNAIYFDLKKCSNCKQMYYCSRSCQKTDWFSHKFECDLYKSFGENIVRNETEKTLSNETKPFERLLLRLLLLMKSNQSISNKVYQLADQSIGLSLDQINSHSNEFRKSPRNLILFDNIFKRFQTFGLEFDREMVFDLFCKLVRYSISSQSLIYDKCKYQMTRNMEILNKLRFVPYVSCGLYIPITVYNHSCVPNACKVFNGKTIQLTAIKPIEQNEEITISYAFISGDKSERQEELRLNYFIRCKCSECESEEEKLDYHRLKDLLHKRNDFASNFDPKNLKAMVEVTKEMIDIYKCILNIYDPNMILINICLYELIKMKNTFNKSEPQESTEALVKSTLNCIRITYGSDHPVFQAFKDVVKLFEALVGIGSIPK